MTRFFCSDHHIDHANIIRFSSRPFADVREMNEALVDYHNMVVKPEDHVSFLGDVTIRRGGRQNKEWFIKEMKKYHGHKRLFLGNHDHFGVDTYREAGFEKVYATWRDEQGLLFSHIPIHPRSIGSAKANVHGHTHTIPDYEPIVLIDKESQRVKYIPYINVCLEMTNYRPIDYDEVLARVAKAKGEMEGGKI